MLVDLLAAVVAVLGVVLGWRARFLPFLVVALGLWIGLLLAVFLLPTLAPSLRKAFDLSPPLAWLLTGGAALGLPLVGVIVFAVLLGVSRRTRVAAGEIPDRLVSRLGGAAAGALVGGLVGLLVAWSAMFWPRLGPMAVEESKATRLAQQALRRLARPAFRLVLPEPVLAGVLADGLADPLGTVQALAAVGRQEPAALLLVDPAFARAMIRGQGRAAAFHPLVHQLWRDDAVRTIGEGRGWIDADFRIHDFRLALEESFADLAPRLRALRFDPVVRAAFRNPEVRHLYQVHDLPGLLGMAQVRAALGRVFGKVVDEGFGLERPEVVAPDKGGSEPERVRLPGGEFYRWTDESGREHYSNRPPGSGAGSGPSTTGEALRPATDRPATSPLLEPLDWPESIDDEDDDEEGETEVEHVPVRGGG